MREQTQKEDPETVVMKSAEPDPPAEKDYDNDLLALVVNLRYCQCLDRPAQRLCGQCHRAYELVRRFIWTREHTELSTLRTEQTRLREALQQLANNELNDDNCASVEVARRRVRNIARAALSSTPTPETTP